MFVLGLKQWYWNRDQCVCILVFIHSYRIILQDGEWNWFHNCHVLLTLLYAILCHVINRNTLCASIDINTPCAVTDTDTAFEWPAYTPCYMSGLSNNTAWRWKHAVAYRTPDFEDNGAGLASWSSHRLWVQISALVQLLKWFVDRVSSDFACRCQWNGQTAHSVLPDWLQLWLRWWWWSALGRAVRMVTAHSDGFGSCGENGDFAQSDSFGSCSENGDFAVRWLWVVQWEWWLCTIRWLWVMPWECCLCTVRQLWFVQWELWLCTVRRLWFVQWEWWLCTIRWLWVVQWEQWLNLHLYDVYECHGELGHLKQKKPSNNNRGHIYAPWSEISCHSLKTSIPKVASGLQYWHPVSWHSWHLTVKVANSPGHGLSFLQCHHCKGGQCSAMLASRPLTPLP